MGRHGGRLQHHGAGSRDSLGTGDVLWRARPGLSMIGSLSCSFDNLHNSLRSFAFHSGRPEGSNDVTTAWHSTPLEPLRTRRCGPVQPLASSARPGVSSHSHSRNRWLVAQPALTAFLSCSLTVPIGSSVPIPVSLPSVWSHLNTTMASLSLSLLATSSMNFFRTGGPVCSVSKARRAHHGDSMPMSSLLLTVQMVIENL
ncbi:hypothetical protein GQ607_007263 [Colletotrichum asianum]|uniref:Uncharacterized protein n=1 Tax=Colletotrichum asianum TaxID=702518 RepID=A0A8H3WGQ6_9PEZI|nr:hypothetical protein GQ607_007263 [Colletotrichum asianum]